MNDVRTRRLRRLDTPERRERRMTVLLAMCVAGPGAVLPADFIRRNLTAPVPALGRVLYSLKARGLVEGVNPRPAYRHGNYYDGWRITDAGWDEFPDVD